MSTPQQIKQALKEQLRKSINIPDDINGYQKIHHMYIEPVELGSSTTNFTNPWSFELYHIGSKYTGFIKLLD